MGEIVHMYNPCRVCGNTEFDMVVARDDKDLPDDTPCIVCPYCGRYGSVANWNKVNGYMPEDPIAV